MLRIRRSTETTLNVGVVCLLVGGMAVISDDVRGHLANMISGDRASELSVLAAPANDLIRVVSATLGDYHVGGGSLLAFGVAAVVLFGLMLRS